MLPRATPERAPDYPRAPAAGGIDTAGTQTGTGRWWLADRETRSVIYAVATAAALLYLLLFGLR